MGVLARLEAEHPELTQKMRQVEEHTARVLQANRSGRTETVNVTIPVVVHVLYKTAAQNITDAQVQSQIDVLNADYSKTNADVSGTPSLFAGLASSMNIQFCLAKTDPNGNTTTGIIHKATTTTSFSDANDGAKYNSLGGDNAWDATKYLNIWVCNLGNGLLGYAQFPGGPVATDGVVILYSAFGSGGTAVAPYNKGRSATHEVGHWLNLRHVWGDASCGNDLVNDTPTQSTSNFGCPAFPHSTCGNTSDMFMNFMDYTDDPCMFMFSAGQVARSQALFATGGSRSSFLTASACSTGTPPPPTCGVPAGLSASSVTQTSATLGWAAVSGATSYSLQYKASSASTWTTVSTSATSYAVSGLTASTAYSYQVSATCASGTSAYSTAGSFTTSGTTTVTYCANAGGSTVDERIGSFSLGSISTGDQGASSAGYKDYTSLSTNLLPGSTYIATYKAAFRSGYTSSEYWRIWIDLNHDGDFADAGEQVASRTSSSATAVTSSFTIPAAATLGATRMRVMMKYGGYGSYCTAGTWSQVEDYTVVIGSGARTSRGLTGAFTLALAPNPVSDVAILQATLPGAEQATIRIYDLQGRQVWHADNVATPAGLLADYGVSVNGFKPGVYMLQVEAAGMRKTVRMSVQ